MSSTRDASIVYGDIESYANSDLITHGALSIKKKIKNVSLHGNIYDVRVPSGIVKQKNTDKVGLTIVKKLIVELQVTRSE